MRRGPDLDELTRRAIAAWMAETSYPEILREDACARSRRPV
ncbi:hypothetical protein [Blastococcus saxobsidens]|uniref:Uncharacterized protein n=1 Tax=Blastococcus saxobsidens (strain DD2) TaxID=1146883 RepID=H6RR52_BLASD|nr:hypothetical protein [Blastococcus saxobsidens]CCG04132.1 protein of unknown function [Blastococcus saxobsidens DD2]